MPDGPLCDAHKHDGARCCVQRPAARKLNRKYDSCCIARRHHLKRKYERRPAVLAASLLPTILPPPARMFHSNSTRSSVHAHRYSQSRPAYATPPPSNPYQAQQLQHQASRRSQAPGVPDQNQLYQWFRKVDTDNSGEISVQELQAALINGKLLQLWEVMRVLKTHAIAGDWSRKLHAVQIPFDLPD